MTGEQAEQGRRVRTLVRTCRKASLATLSPEEGTTPVPHVSLVLVAADLDASPLLLLSDLALHTRNLRRDPHAALLFDGTEGLTSPLAGERATVTGLLEPCRCERCRARYLRYQPEAASYADFADFALYRMRVTGAHLVAGFGRIARLPGEAVLLPEETTRGLAEEEEALCGELDRELADRLRAPTAAANTPDDGWRLLGLDPEGLDLARGGERRRLSLPAPVTDPEGLRAAAVDLLKAMEREGRARDAV